MTLFLVDVASWQTTEKRPRDPLDLAKVKAAGFDLVNIKIGQGDWYGYRSWMRTYADRARQLGLGVCTFHWLDNSASGAAQARIAFARMKEIGGPDGMAHQCDCEDTTGRPATERIWRDYVSAMQDLLGRPIVNYTGDWWWNTAARNWKGANLTPYLWAAPNVGYLGKYPGDGSSHWRAGYGGWQDYAVLQYAVSPIAGAGGGNLSKSAIRDPKVWAALTGEHLEDDMPTAEEIAQAVWAHQFGSSSMKVPARPAADWMKAGLAGERKVGEVATALAALRGDVATALGRDPVDEQAIVSGVLAGLGARPAADVAKALQAAGVDLAALRDELTKLDVPQS
ncbi:GH25 family lysozyme [Micromonospora chersina]|uniref:GH25 family lysozyme n=1 Tax=Micromonospora chersina TaxID=47854 RepID=UPI0033C1269D